MRNLAFVNENFINSLFYALKVAKNNKVGLATMPELANIRINADPNKTFAWNRWITPFTTIYFGKHDGKRLIVVAHHLGPLSTKKRLLEWDDSGFVDPEGGRYKYGSAGLPKVTKQEFSDLITGKYGEVITIDIDEYRKNFSSHLAGDFINKSNALQDPLLKALFGEYLEKFVNKHFELSQKFAKAKGKQPGSEDKILKLNICDRYGWTLFLSDEHFNFPEEQPIGLFLTFSGPSYYSNHDLSVATEIRIHEDLDIGRFVVLKDKTADFRDIAFEAAKHWQQCLTLFKKEVPNFFALEKIGNKFFTQYPKKGNRMDTCQIMFPVLSHKKIGKQTSFTTPTYGSPFLKYHIDEVKAIAPPEANAYLICGDVLPAKKVVVTVQFYKVEVDVSKRIMREDEVMRNLSLLLKLNNIAA